MKKLELFSNVDQLPVGWDNGVPTKFQPQQNGFLALIGWLMTAIAAAMGALFWFDLLSKVVNIRNTLKPISPDDKPVKKP